MSHNPFLRPLYSRVGKTVNEKRHGFLSVLRANYFHRIHCFYLKMAYLFDKIVTRKSLRYLRQIYSLERSNIISSHVGSASLSKYIKIPVFPNTTSDIPQFYKNPLKAFYVLFRDIRFVSITFRVHLKQ